MIITLTRSGGFTGIPLTKIVDTKDLPPEKIGAIENLVKKSNFFSLASAQTAAKPDRFTYTITINNDPLKNTLSISEIDLNPELHELIQVVLQSTKM